MITVTKIFTFDSAHHLPFHKGKCKNLHGHTYKLEVTVCGRPDENGMLIDFGDLKKIVSEKIIEKYDHKNLNEFFEHPTAEIMVGSIALELAETIPGISKVRLWETPTSYAEWIDENN